jgi:prepilin-type N-terminal cleavage/methylation domain-containing protein
MNNKGFTLTEVLAVLIIISIALLVTANEIGKTLSM